MEQASQHEHRASKALKDVAVASANLQAQADAQRSALANQGQAVAIERQRTLEVQSEIERQVANKLKRLNFYPDVNTGPVYTNA